jgi:Skp family chaperone for outer membrane proteins
MNRFTALACLGFGLMVSPVFGSFADSAVPMTPRIGAIDIERTLSETPAGKRANADFDAKRKAKQAELDAKKSDFMKAEADLQKQASILKPEVLQQRKDELAKQYAELGQLAQKLEQNLAQEGQQMTAALLKQADPIIKEIAKSEGVQLIVDSKQVIWFDPTMDLTDKLDAKMK